MSTLQADNSEIQDAVSVVARSFAKSFPRFELDDLRQEGYVAVIKALPTYRDYLGTPFQWAYGVTRNRLTDVTKGRITEDKKREEMGDYPVDGSRQADEAWTTLWGLLSPWARAVLLLQLSSVPKQLSARCVAKQLGLPVRDCLWLFMEMRAAFQSVSQLRSR